MTSRPAPFARCGPPSAIHLVAAFTGLHVVIEELVAHCAAVSADKSVHAVDIGFLRPLAQPGNSVETGREDHLHAQARQFGKIRFPGYEVGLYQYFAIAEHGVLRGPAHIGLRQREGYGNGYTLWIGGVHLELANLGVLMGRFPYTLALFHAPAAVIVNGCAPEVGAQRGFDEFHAINGQRGKGARGLVKTGCHTLAGYGRPRDVFLDRQGGHSFSGNGQGRRSVGEFELIPGDLMSFRSPGFILYQAETQVKEILDAGRWLERRYRDRYQSGGQGRQGRAGEGALLKNLAVTRDLPVQFGDLVREMKSNQFFTSTVRAARSAGLQWMN